MRCFLLRSPKAPLPTDYGHCVQCGGFTLVEMLVVLALVAIVATISFPYAQDPGGKLELKAAAQSVEALLQRQRFLALAQNKPQQVIFDSSLGVIVDAVGNLLWEMPPDMAVSIKTSRSGVSAGQSTIQFFADGGSIGDAVAISNKKFQVLIKINRLTGATQTEDVPVQ